MCYAIPGKVKKIESKIAFIDYFWEEKKAINEIDTLKLGDYIYAQGGYVIEVIPEEEAKEILSVWKETFFELQEMDLRLSKLNLEKEGIDKKLINILDRAIEKGKVSNEELLYLLNIEGQKEIGLLKKTANFLRQKYLKNSCCVHGIIEISNVCSQDCKYCGISYLNKKITRYKMTKEEILETVHEAVEIYGFKALVLQAGEGAYLADELYEVIKEIKNKYSVLIFISFGEIGIKGLKKLFEAGARGLLLRFETSNERIYKDLHPLKSLETRIEHLKKAYEIGYLIITGGLIGLPGQTKEDLLNDILLAKELNAEMYSFGPFLPHPDTPLKNEQLPGPLEMLKVLAVSRITNPENAKILVTTGFETLDKKAREEGLMAGANSVMLNVTPKIYRKNYSIYPNRAHEKEPIKEQIDVTLAILRNMGRAPTDLGVNA